MYFSTAFFFPGVFIICVPVVGCYATAAVVLMFLATVMEAAGFSGSFVTHVDISPDFAGENSFDQIMKIIFIH